MENQMNEQFMKLQHDLHRYLRSRAAKNPTMGPHRGQGRILALLKLNPEISQKELTFVLDMRPQSVGELLQKLEDKEWITREASEADRRVMIVRLTELGKEEAEKVSKRPDFGEELFADFTEEEKIEWSRLVEKLSNTLKSHFSEEESEETFGGGHEFTDPRFSHRGGHHGFGGPHGQGTRKAHHFSEFDGFNW